MKQKWTLPQYAKITFICFKMYVYSLSIQLLKDACTFQNLCLISPGAEPFLKGHFEKKTVGKLCCWIFYTCLLCGQMFLIKNTTVAKYVETYIKAHTGRMCWLTFFGYSEYWYTRTGGWTKYPKIRTCTCVVETAWFWTVTQGTVVVLVQGAVPGPWAAGSTGTCRYGSVPSPSQ